MWLFQQVLKRFWAFLVLVGFTVRSFFIYIQGRCQTGGKFFHNQSKFSFVGFPLVQCVTGRPESLTGCAFYEYIRGKTYNTLQVFILFDFFYFIYFIIFPLWAQNIQCFIGYVTDQYKVVQKWGKIIRCFTSTSLWNMVVGAPYYGVAPL